MFGIAIQVLANAPANGHINALIEGQSAEYSLVVSNTHRMMNKKKYRISSGKGAALSTRRPIYFLIFSSVVQKLGHFALCRTRHSVQALFSAGRKETLPESFAV